jgi:hippurate hydrolase
VSHAVLAQDKSELIDRAVAENSDKFLAIFKEIHEHPELGFMEERTAAIVAGELGSYGYEVTESIGGTGVAAVLKNGDGPVVMYRADMDANAVLELTNLPYKSNKIATLADGNQTPVIHACGHECIRNYAVPGHCEPRYRSTKCGRDHCRLGPGG